MNKRGEEGKCSDIPIKKISAGEIGFPQRFNNGHMMTRATSRVRTRKIYMTNT